jgi:TonB family protein
MKKLIIAALFIFSTLLCAGQKTETRYYNDRGSDEEVPKEKAKYSESITTNPDGSITKESKNLKKNEVYHRQTLKGEEPVGSWIYLTGRGPAEMDYDFQLEYSTDDCSRDSNIKDYFADDPAAGYEAPKLSTGEAFVEFVRKNMVYPSRARREGIQGKVELTFEFTADGLIKNIRVKKGVHMVLDKEAMRVLRKLKFSTRPKINGQPKDLCGNVSLSFRLA